MVESSGLLNRRRGINLYRGFESPPLRQLAADRLRWTSLLSNRSFVTGTRFASRRAEVREALQRRFESRPRLQRAVPIRFRCLDVTGDNTSRKALKIEVMLKGSRVQILGTASLVVSVWLLGCGSNTDSPAETNESPQAERLQGEDLDTPGARFAFQIKNGEHAGSYELASFDPQPCQIGMTGVNTFSVNASGQPPSLVYAEAFIPDFQAGGGSTEIVAVAAKSAEFEFRIDTTENALMPGGHGTAAYTDDGGNNIVIRISGETDDGIAVEATVDCDRVGR